MTAPARGTKRAADLATLLAQVATVRAAIREHMEPLILACSIGDVRESFCAMFAAAYQASAPVVSAAFPARDEREYHRDCRHTIPLFALSQIESELLDEVLLPDTLRLFLLAAVELLRRRIDRTLPVPRTRQRQDAAVIDLCALLHDELVRRALDHSARWTVDNDAGLADIRAAREERYRRFVFEQRPRPGQPGIVVSKSMVARSADVDRKDFRRYLKGMHGDDSLITHRIEQVLDGQRPLLATTGRPERRLPPRKKSIPRGKRASPSSAAV